MRRRATWRSTSSRRPRPWRATWPSTDSPSFWTSTTSPARSTSWAGSRGAWSGRRWRPTSWRCWRPPRSSGWPRALSASRSCAGRGAVTPRSSRSWRTTAVSPRPRTPGWRPSWRTCGRAAAPTSSSSGGSSRPRPSTSWSRRCGPTAGSTTRRLACTSWAARRASSTPRPCRTMWTTSDCPPPSACRARCRTRRSPPTSRRPTSTSRCRPTRVSGSRSSRRWWPVCPSSRGAPGRCPTPWPMPRSVLAAADPSYVAAAVHRVCTDEQLRATLTAAGVRRAAELSADAATRIVDAVAAVVGRP